MNRRLAALLVRLYPPGWRARFGDEVEDLLAEQGVGPRQLFDLLRAASAERLFDHSGLGGYRMASYPRNVLTLARKPSALIPIAMSGLAGALLAGVILFSLAHGALPHREHDEGAAAHLYQLLIAGQLPFLAFFAFKWLGRNPLACAGVIGLQLAAIVVTMIPLWLLGL